MKRFFSVFLTLVVILILALPVQAKMIPSGDELVPAAQKQVLTGNYIVQLKDPPAIDYSGGIAGLRATAVNGQRINPNSATVRAYTAHLRGRHDAVLAAVGGQKLYNYVYTFNGFAARLTAAQADLMAQQPEVFSVTPDEIHYADTVTTPDFLGMRGAGGVWEQVGGEAMAGRNIVVGIIDSGIWPENASFAWSENLGIRPMVRWTGVCETGEDWTAELCNGKILGARYFNEGWGGDAGIEAQRPWEFNSPRDYNGHGTHTASTSAGNSGVTATGPDGSSLGQISGMAPAARIAVYKALWSTVDGSTAGGTTVDLVAAIDQAVADGVDVINYSISGSQTSNADPAEMAFLRAARAGVFVAASAGNSGPTASTVAHNSPWLTTVAAGTHDRAYPATVTLGNAAVYTGVSLGGGTPVLPVILASEAGLPGADPTAVSLCYSSLDPGGLALDSAKVAGKIVVCDRGVTARVNKSLAVNEAGGAGMILANVSPASLNADLHTVPSVHVDEIAGAAIKAYVTSAGAAATAQLSPGLPVSGSVAPDVASFSSRGPARTISGNILKPDLMAPGVDVLAAVSPSVGGLHYNFLSGTSMSSPHVAGIAAVFMNAHPDWSPMMIKSALMTTATQTRNNGTAIAGGVFAYGAGQVRPINALDPGLVFDSRVRDWLGYLCGSGQLLDPRCPVVNISVNDMNSASVAISALAGSQAVTRTVTSVGTVKETYTASVTGMTGVSVSVSPASFTLRPQQSANLSITFTRTTAALNAYAQGFLVLTGNKGHVVQIPLAVRPVALAAPAEVSGAGGDITYDVKFGYDGAFTAAPRGLVPAITFVDTINTGEAFAYDVVVPAGTTYARFALFNAYTTAPDLDLEVYRGATLVGSSGSGTSDEVVNLLNPTAATYTVVVVGYDSGGSPADFTLFNWVLGSTDAGNMTVSAPATAVIGQTAPITLSFSGLASGTFYLGSVAYTGVSGMPNPTIVSVNVP